MKLEPEDLQPIKELFRDAIREELSAGLQNLTLGRSGDTVFDVPGLCDYLHVTPKWVHERTHLKEIPFYKISNKQLRFRKREIDKWLDSLRTPAIHPLSSRLKIMR